MTQDTILTVNAGSSSIKLGLFDFVSGAIKNNRATHIELSEINGEQKLTIVKSSEEVRSRNIRPDDPSSYDEAFATVFAELDELLTDKKIVTVGHRIVHGGASYSAPAVLNDDTIESLKTLIPLAPAHQPHNLRGVAIAMNKWPESPQVACFDTAFHRSQGPVAERYAIPDEISDGEIRRYGFHGLSYEFVWGEAERVMGNARKARTIIAHLGSGASMCGLLNGKSVATTMGFTPLDGLPMGTRSGAIDPGVLLYLMQEKGMTGDEIARCLYSQSGLLGISGENADMAALEQSGDPRAENAIAYFVYRAAREIGSLAAALGGVDALIFTGGIGENSTRIRREIIAASAWLGFELDETANAKGKPCITKPDQLPSAWVIPTNEELMIARHTYRCMKQA